MELDLHKYGLDMWGNKYTLMSQVSQERQICWDTEEEIIDHTKKGPHYWEGDLSHYWEGDHITEKVIFHRRRWASKRWWGWKRGEKGPPWNPARLWVTLLDTKAFLLLSFLVCRKKAPFSLYNFPWIPKGRFKQLLIRERRGCRDKGGVFWKQ